MRRGSIEVRIRMGIKGGGEVVAVGLRGFVVPVPRWGICRKRCDAMRCDVMRCDAMRCDARELRAAKGEMWRRRRMRRMSSGTKWRKWHAVCGVDDDEGGDGGGGGCRCVGV
jgi:hypothetical protein